MNSVFSMVTTALTVSVHFLTFVLGYMQDPGVCHRNREIDRYIDIDNKTNKQIKIVFRVPTHFKTT